MEVIRHFGHFGRKIRLYAGLMYLRFAGLAKWATALTAIAGCVAACWSLASSWEARTRQQQARDDHVGEVQSELLEVKGDVKKLVGDVGDIKGTLRTFLRDREPPHLSFDPDLSNPR
jgi:hypothetical protein